MIKSEDEARKIFEKDYLGGHCNQRFADGNHDYVDGRIQRDWIMFQMGFDFAWALSSPSKFVDHTGTPVINLDLLQWETIKEASNKSPWMPDDYYMNDWVNDVCKFLTDERDEDDNS